MINYCQYLTNKLVSWKLHLFKVPFIIYDLGWVKDLQLLCMSNQCWGLGLLFYFKWIFFPEILWWDFVFVKRFQNPLLPAINNKWSLLRNHGDQFCNIHHQNNILNVQNISLQLRCDDWFYKEKVQRLIIIISN